MYKTLKKTIEAIERDAKNTHLLIKTGFKSIDAKYFGIAPGETWVIGAYTGTGKTFFMLQLMLNIIKQEKRVCYFSLEMRAEPLTARIWGNLAGLSPTRLEFGLLKPDEFMGRQEARSKLLDLQEYLYFFDTDREIEKIIESIQDMVNMGKKPDIVFLDYIQNISTKGRSEYENLTEAMKTLDTFAKKNNIPIIIASQTSNEGERKESSDKVVSYKGSGAIAAASDFGLWLSKDIQYDFETSYSIITVKFKKMRRGPHTKIMLKHEYPSGRIYEQEQNT